MMAKGVCTPPFMVEAMSVYSHRIFGSPNLHPIQQSWSMESMLFFVDTLRKKEKRGFISKKKQDVWDISNHHDLFLEASLMFSFTNKKMTSSGESSENQSWKWRCFEEPHLMRQKMVSKVCKSSSELRAIRFPSLNYPHLEILVSLQQGAAKKRHILHPENNS